MKFKFFVLSLLCLCSTRAFAYNAQVSLDLRCLAETHWFKSDSIYVVTSLSRSGGLGGESRLAWAGQMSDEGASSFVSGIPLWSGSVARAENMALTAHVFVKNGASFNAGSLFGLAFAQQGLSAIFRAPFGSDTSQVMLAMAPSVIADIDFRNYIKNRSDSYPGSLTLMIGSLPNGVPTYFTYPTYRATPASERIYLNGDGGKYEAKMNVSYF